jgi:uncharacterized protein YmfQ (DUF2313 family)
MARNVDNYLRLLQSLLPRGKVWSRALNARLTEYLHAEADELTRLDNRAQVLLKERNTLTTTELINDHEIELGLPDECTRSGTLTLTERRLAANTKLTATGGQSKEYFIEIAKQYGYVATITEYSPFWCGVGVCGDPIGPQTNLFYWKLTLFTNETPIIFRCGESACGDPLQKVSELINTVFCFVNKYKPAHTALLTSLEGAGFDTGFGSGFDSLPSSSVGYLTGGFNKGFSFGFNLNLGGGFTHGFTNGFERPPT